MTQEIPTCPDCGEPMMFDGIGYVCLCQLRRAVYGTANPGGAHGRGAGYMEETHFRGSNLSTAYSSGNYHTRRRRPADES